MKTIIIDKQKHIRAALPEAWAETTDRQKEYLFTLLSTDMDKDTTRRIAAIRFTGIHIGRRMGSFYTAWRSAGRFSLTRQRFTITEKDIDRAAAALDFIDKFQSAPRVSRFGRQAKAVGTILSGVPFIDYLSAEKYYQQYLSTRNEQALVWLAQILYRRRDGSPARMKRLKAWQTAAVFYWFTYIKQYYAAIFPDFFRPAVAKKDDRPHRAHRYMEQVNTMVRALTGGDVTKEHAINQTDTLRALTELNAKAREATLLKKQLQKK